MSSGGRFSYGLGYVEVDRQRADVVRVDRMPKGQAPSIDENYSGLRKKDRITYKHNMFQIDLTQVKTFEVSLGVFYIIIASYFRH